MAISQDERQNAWLDAGDRLFHGIMSSVRSTYLARIVKYDSKHHTADIQPLANLSTGEKSAQYLDVPITRNCYILDEWLDKVKSDFAKIDGKTSSNLAGKMPKKMLKTGAPVIVAIVDGDTDNWDGTGKTYTPNSSRMHSPNDSIIIGVL